EGKSAKTLRVHHDASSPFFFFCFGGGRSQAKHKVRASQGVHPWSIDEKQKIRAGSRWSYTHENTGYGIHNGFDAATKMMKETARHTVNRNRLRTKSDVTFTGCLAMSIWPPAMKLSAQSLP